MDEVGERELMLMPLLRRLDRSWRTVASVSHNMLLDPSDVGSAEELGASTGSLLDCG